MSPRRQGKRVRAKAGAHRPKDKCGTSRRKPAPQPAPDFHAILGRLSDAIAIVACAARAMAAIEQREGSLAEPAADIGEEIITLEYGAQALRAAYDEMDVAMRAVLP